MNDNQQQKYRALIGDHLAALTQDDRLGQQGQSVVSLDQQAVGRLSRMDALQSQAMAKANQVRRDGNKRALLAALARLDNGEFGYCEDCGDDIAAKRLEFSPFVTKCITCARG